VYLRVYRATCSQLTACVCSGALLVSYQTTAACFRLTTSTLWLTALCGGLPVAMARHPSERSGRCSLVCARAGHFSASAGRINRLGFWKPRGFFFENRSVILAQLKDRDKSTPKTFPVGQMNFIRCALRSAPTNERAKRKKKRDNKHGAKKTAATRTVFSSSTSYFYF
jgi:hypothetical protein